ncbi:MAG: hypothetical protein ACW987_13065 [Candidatus Thorarchaeota archaeon]|jgi:hypothetical protein
MNDELIELSREEILTRASKHIFSTGLDDSAHRLCVENMKYGLAKIHFTQNKLGLEPNATFVGAPDATITRNVRRWSNGVGYGGKLSWGEGSDKLVILDTMPNACGMFVGGLPELPDMRDLLGRINDLLSEPEVIDGIKVDWDFAVSNHFIDIYKVNPSTTNQNLQHEYAFIIHGSAPELKGDNDTKFKFGLYHHNSSILRELADSIETPFGDIRILTEDAAQKYLEFYEFAASLSIKKRRLAADFLFEDYGEICNPIHQGLLNLNEIALGCHIVDKESDNTIFPIALRADLPAYLLEGIPNLNDEVIEYLGFEKRARKFGVLERLTNANILPHGGGYDFPHLLRVKQVLEESNNQRYFVTDMGTGHDSEMVFKIPRELQFSYRGRQVLARTLELGLGTVVANLMPRIVLKV